MLRILLVHPPCNPREKAFPLGLAYLAAALTAAGHRVTGLDLGVERPARWPAAAANVDVVGMSAMSATWPTVRQLLAALPPDQGRLVVVGGPHATLFPDEILAEPVVDAAIAGEGDRVIGDVLRAWQQWRAGTGDAISAPSFPGVVWQQRWLQRGFRSQRDALRIDELGASSPDLRLFPLAAYTGMLTRRRRYTQMIASRGCRRACAHCPASRLLPGGRRARPVEDVVGEMVLLRERFGIDEFHFEDDSLFEEPAYVGALCRQIRRELPGVLWQCPNGCHPADLHLDMLAELAAAGCYRIYLGLHGVSVGAMQRLERVWDPATLDPLALEAGRLGLELGGYFTVGLPGESEADMRATVRFAVASRLAWAQFTPFRFIPGSALHAQRESLAGLLPPEPLVRRIVGLGYRQFYRSGGRWRYVLRSLNARNMTQMLARAYRKLLRGSPAEDRIMTGGK